MTDRGRLKETDRETGRDKGRQRIWEGLKLTGRDSERQVEAKEDGGRETQTWGGGVRHTEEETHGETDRLQHRGAWRGEKRGSCSLRMRQTRVPGHGNNVAALSARTMGESSGSGLRFERLTVAALTPTPRSQRVFMPVYRQHGARSDSKGDFRSPRCY